ncbi:MAG: hypothetical protein ABSA75_01650 [Candidatus Bathyarchaeia archaeon]|jgi:hypothetical protein
MSSLQKMTIGEVTPQLERLFESFGVKSIIIQKDNEWTNVATVIQLTRRTVDDLSKEYRFLEEKLGKIDEDNFKIVLQARPIQEFKEVVKELEKGYLKIGEISTKMSVSNIQSIANQRITHNWGAVSRIAEYAEYDFYCVTMGMNNDPFYAALADLDSFATSMGFRDRDELLCSWLGVGAFYQQNTFFVIIPIYATIGEIQYQGGSEIKFSFKIDQRLSDNSWVWLTRSPQGDRVPIIERKKYDISSYGNLLQDGFLYATIRHRFLSISANDKISVSLSNRNLDLLSRKEGITFPFPSESIDLFLKVFFLFDAGKKMEEHILNPKEPEDLEAGFTWLLEMLDITSLQLGHRNEQVREEKTEKGSADIISCYHESTSNIILAIDCTMAVPDGHKIDKIKNTAEFISRKIGFPVRPIIVTSEKSSITKELGKKHSVKILDSTDLDQIIAYYKKSQAVSAREVILN